MYDLGLKPEERPNATGVFTLPKEYLDVLHELEIDEKHIAISYESTLRNRVRKDELLSLKINSNKGIPVAICANIMGKFYDNLASQGYERQIGFYSLDKPKLETQEQVDNACPYGQQKGALEHESGYAPRIGVNVFWVYPNGAVIEKDNNHCRLERWIEIQK